MDKDRELKLKKLIKTLTRIANTGWILFIAFIASIIIFDLKTSMNPLLFMVVLLFYISSIREIEDLAKKYKNELKEMHKYSFRKNINRED